MKVTGYVIIEYSTYRNIHSYGIVLDGNRKYAVSAQIKLPRIGDIFTVIADKSWYLHPKFDKFREMTKLEGLLLGVEDV